VTLAAPARERLGRRPFAGGVGLPSYQPKEQNLMAIKEGRQNPPAPPGVDAQMRSVLAAGWVA
jgi:hypothetical protein